MSAFNLILCIFYLLKSTLSYDVEWSDSFEYYESASRNPYTVNIRGQEEQSLVICFEELQDDKYSGICEGAQLDIENTQINYGPKTLFQLYNASNPYEIQIWAGGETGWTNYFLLAYTNGPDRAEGPGKVVMGQYLPNDQRIIYGTSQGTFNPYFNDQSVLIELQNNSYFIVCSSIGPRNQYNTECRVGKYDLETLLVGFGSRTFNISTGHTTTGMAVTRINSNNFLVCFGEYLAIKEGVCVVGTVTNNFQNGIETPITFGTKLILDEDGGVDEIKIIHLSSTVLAICYTVDSLIPDFENVGRCRLATIQQIGSTTEYTVVIQNKPVDFQSNGIDSPTIFRVPANVLVPNNNNPELLGVCYVDANNGVCKFGQVDLDEMSIIFDADESKPFADRGVGTINAIYLGGEGENSNTNDLVVCYIKFAGSTPLFNRGLCKFGSIIEQINYS